jgi:hypothetical protein
MLFNARLYLKLNHAEDLVMQSLEMRRAMPSPVSTKAANVDSGSVSCTGDTLPVDMQNLKLIVTSSLKTLKNVSFKVK